MLLPIRRAYVFGRSRRRAVSEVVGSALLLGITVSAFAVLFVLVNGMPTPLPGVAADLQASLERTGPTTVNVILAHVGGEDLQDRDTLILITVNSTTLTYNVSAGLSGQAVFAVGKQWRMNVPLPVSPDTRLVVTVVSLADNRILYNADLQTGYQAGSAGFPPIIVVAYAQAGDGSSRVSNGGVQTYRIHAVVIDPDGNLDSTTGVWVDATVAAVGPTFQTTAIGSGRYNLTRTQASSFQTPDLVMGAGVPPGNYTFTIHAQDGTGGNTTRITPPFTVVAVGGGSGPTLTVSGYSLAPVSVNTTTESFAILSLNLTASGADTSLAQIVVSKGGSLSDAQVTVSVWTDVNSDGAFSATNDMQTTPETAFTAGMANVFAVPITTIPNGGTRVVFVVASLLNAADGTNATFSMADTASVRGTGVPGGQPATTTGIFPITSSDVVVGSKFSFEYASGSPDRMLVGSKNVRLLEFSVRAAGETFNVKKVNITLLGTLPRSAASCYIKINGTMIAGAANFDATRTARFSLTTPVLDSAGWLRLEVFANVTGTAGQTLAFQVTAVGETFAQGQVSLKGRNGASTSSFPISGGLVTLTTAGNLSIDEWNETALATQPRAGATSVYLHTLKLRAHGENIDFNKLEMVQTGNLTDGQFLAVTLRVRGGVWLSGTFFAGKVTWDAGVTGKLLAITINATNTGEALVDVYTNLTTGVQAKEFSMYLNDNTKVRGYGKTSLSSLFANGEAAPYPISLGVRRIQGDVLMWGTDLAPVSILAPANLVPLLKLTIRTVGENASLDEIFLRSLQGIPSAGLVTLLLYHDTNNDTTTALQGDDVDIGLGEAGPFGTDAVKAFTPGVTITVGTDFNIVFAVNATAAAAGFSLETRVNASNSTVRGLYSSSVIPPNSQAGITNPPVTMTQTPAVLIYERGTLVAVGASINPEDHVHEWVVTKMLRVTLTAAGENVNLNSLRVTLNGNVEDADVNVALWWDENKDSEVDGSDVQLGLLNFVSGDVTFSGSPLKTITAGTTEYFIVRINIMDGGQQGKTAGVQVTSASSFGATGLTSGLAITVTGTFPLQATTVSVYD